MSQRSRTDLCGGRRATDVPTATDFPANGKLSLSTLSHATGAAQSLPDAQRSGLEVKNGLEAHVEAGRCILMASGEAKMEIMTQKCAGRVST